MSGGILPLFTNVNPTPLWGSGGGGGASNVSSFQTASISSLTASTITVGSVNASNVVASQVGSAIVQTALIYSSTLTAALPGNASTTLFSVNSPGMYNINMSLITSPVFSAGIGGSFVVSKNTTSGQVNVTTIATVSNATYALDASVNGGNIDFTFANNGGSTLSYYGAYTRIGF